MLSKRYNDEPVKLSKGDLNLAISLRDMVANGEITQEEAVKRLNNELILT